MKRTYFVPLCVLAGVLLVAGIAGFALAAASEDLFRQRDELFETRYRDPGSALYVEALKLRHSLTFEQRDRTFFTGAVSIGLGLLLSGWAFDRRRLIRQITRLDAEEDTGRLGNGLGTP